MFDLNNAVSEWRRQMANGGVTAPELLDELEGHLRDDVEHQARLGSNTRLAFETAARRLGHAGELKNEFKKMGRSTEGTTHMKRAILILAGIPAEASAEHPTAHIEPGWATYVKAAVFLLPAVGLWTVSVILLFPKLQQICRNAGVAIPGVYGVIHEVTANPLWIFSAIVAALALLEWRSAQWPRYRRAAIGMGVFLLNTSVLLLITIMVILALLAAPALMHRAG